MSVTRDENARDEDARDEDGATLERISFTGGVPAILAELPAWVQDVFRVLVCVAFFSCGTAVQGAGSRLTYPYARDRAIAASG